MSAADPQTRARVLDVSEPSLVQQLSPPDEAIVPFRLLNPAATVPGYAHDGDAGADLCVYRDLLFPAGGRALVPTGVAVALPPGTVGFVTPRSGLAARHGITVLNAPGTVDAGYRGELKVLLLNTSAEDFPVRAGDRIAQIVVQPVLKVAFVPVEELPGSARGAGGFGSTGGFGPTAVAPSAPASPAAERESTT